MRGTVEIFQQELEREKEHVGDGVSHGFAPLLKQYDNRLENFFGELKVDLDG